jgi:hypothetical protein
LPQQRGSAQLTNHQHNIIVVLMIPPLIEIRGAPYRVLPPGIHWSGLAEIGARFVTNEHRLRLFTGFTSVTDALWAAGCATIYLGGSFTTEKESPKDYDGCWELVGVQVAKLDPVLLDFSNLRAAQKQKYLGEMFLATTTMEISGSTFLDFIQIEKATGQKKGIIGIRAATEQSST